MADNVKTVWILGSGFSAGLGGPLLNELLSPSGKSKMLSKYDSVRDEVGVVYDTYWRHHPELRKEVGNHGAIYWRHAEQFLDFIDEAATRSGPRTMALLRAVAYALCTGFLHRGVYGTPSRGALDRRRSASEIEGRAKAYAESELGE